MIQEATTRQRRAEKAATHFAEQAASTQPVVDWLQEKLFTTEAAMMTLRAQLCRAARLDVNQRAFLEQKELAHREQQVALLAQIGQVQQLEANRDTLLKQQLASALREASQREARLKSAVRYRIKSELKFLRSILAEYPLVEASTLGTEITQRKQALLEALRRKQEPTEPQTPT